MARVYVYKIVADNGGAPCVWKELLSLALCKPQIRKSAKEKDVIFGFGGKDYGERLIYIAEITRKPKAGEYYQKVEFAARPDCIYAEDAVGVPQRKSTATYHKDTDERRRDVGMKFESAYVLLSENFRYWGGNGTDWYKHEFPLVSSLVEGLKQGHRVNHSVKLQEQLMALKDKMWSQYGKMILGRPTETDKARICNR